MWFVTDFRLRWNLANLNLVMFLDHPHFVDSEQSEIYFTLYIVFSHIFFKVLIACIHFILCECFVYKHVYLPQA